jgi:hypothetical protein
MSRRKRLWRWLIVAAVLVVASAAIMWWLSRMAPAWWRPPDPRSPEVAELADRVEFRIVEEAQKIRSPEERLWRLRIREEQVNSWLAARLPAWIARQPSLVWPESFGRPQVHFQRDGLTLALEVRGGSRSRVLIGRFRPRLTSDGLYLPIDSLHIGRVRVPGDPVSRIQHLLADPETSEAFSRPVLDDLIRVLRGDAPLAPFLSLADQRRIRLRGVELGLGEVVLSLETLPAAAASLHETESRSIKEERD